MAARVAVVDANNVVHLRQVELGRDLGSTIEITSGLSEQDRFVVTPPDGLQEGVVVSPVVSSSSSGAGP